ncbi:MAG: hypothetical protein ABI700_30400 [Chloroflexota bacterium]
MLKRSGLWLAICMLMFVHVASAQTETPDTFPLVVKCLGTPTLPPKGWTYPGMILMSGYAGIHAVQADWDTPHVVAQFTIDQQGNVPINGGQLSPDGNWYATPIGEIYYEETFNDFWIVRGLKIYGLSGNNKTITLDLMNYPNSLSGQSAWGFSPVTWQDNQSLTVGELLIHPFEPTIMHSETSKTDVFTQPRVISPDLSRGYQSYNDNSGFHWNIYDLTHSKRLTDIDRLNHISWRRDSSGFMAQMQQPDQDWHGLAYFDRDGKLIDHVLQFDANPYAVDHIVSGRSESQWSPDSRYYGFVLDPYNVSKTLYLVDTQTRQVDTCLRALTQPVWSPDGTMFAYLTNAPQNLYLIVVDTKTWKSYVVARQSGARGWFGTPEMVGWRSTTETQ